MHFKELSLLLSFVVLPGLAVAQAPVVDIGSGGRQQANSQQSMQGELYQQLQQLRQEMMQLRGTIEEQGHQIRQLKQQSLDRYIDLDRRISGAGANTVPASEAEDTMLDGDAVANSGDAGMAAAGAGAQVGAVAGTGGRSGGDSPTSASTGAAASGSRVAGEVAEPADTSSTGDPSSDYAKAYGLVRDRKFDEAIVAFNEYVAKYPDERYTPNAWYWLGELYLAVKPQNLQASTQAFQKLLADFPNSGKIPAAMYKLATVYFLNDQKQKSKELLTHVIDRYSNTGNSAVQKSREFLRKNF
ncbi:tol-pal system protein YbgF [Spongiibacter sp. IMCC21906]|uniref:tol-pal system protein YbgF n=1 Tax=Spongiibacter sp. IMCC21906 TaxID=1620392 RepID=UPI00062DD294|nr:tol-pal system protein YbgF [Spongiibacter sp. IMCC21906]AKH70395.1 tol-pal system protein YbgF [Spongiibacter sp. IMCC21906]